MMLIILSRGWSYACVTFSNAKTRRICGPAGSRLVLRVQAIGTYLNTRTEPGEIATLALNARIAS